MDRFGCSSQASLREIILESQMILYILTLRLCLLAQPLQYAIFGRVTKGDETLTKLEQLPTRREGIFVMVYLYSTFSSCSQQILVILFWLIFVCFSSRATHALDVSLCSEVR